MVVLADKITIKESLFFNDSIFAIFDYIPKPLFHEKFGVSPFNPQKRMAVYKVVREPLYL